MRHTPRHLGALLAHVGDAHVHDHVVAGAGPVRHADGAHEVHAHDEPDAYAAGEDYFPDALEPQAFYRPVPRGLELKIGEKLNHLAQLDRLSPRQRRKT